MYLLANGRVITRDPAMGYLKDGGVLIDGTKIREVGTTAALRAAWPEAELIDARGGVIMPALINAHTHIYSALARGLSLKGYNATNFYEVLDGMWWAIDRKLRLDGTRASANALMMDCIKQGVTTIFDHHASYAEIPGSLHTIAESAKRFGLRACLCYEVSDRDGEEKCLQAIRENADFITECERRQDQELFRSNQRKSEAPVGGKITTRLFLQLFTIPVEFSWQLCYNLFCGKLMMSGIKQFAFACRFLCCGPSAIHGCSCSQILP